MKDRLIVCVYYKNEGTCKISNKNCHFFKEMQKCNKYSPLKGGRSARKDLRREKEEKFMGKERYWE